MDKQVILFGAGKTGIKALQMLNQEDVFCFVDNDPKKTGKIINGKHVISFKRLCEIATNYKIIICSYSYAAIAEQLKAAGIFDFTKFTVPVNFNLKNRLEELHIEKYCHPAVLGSSGHAQMIVTQIEKLLEKPLTILPGRDELGKASEKELDIPFNTDCVILADPIYHLADEAMILRLTNGNVKVLNPFRMRTYYPTDVLLVNKYEAAESEAMSEEDWNLRTRNKDTTFNAINAYVHEMTLKLPIFKLVEIETINRCNGMCSFCPVNKFKDTRAEHIMDENLFNKIVEELAQMNYSGRVSLFSNNEPLLDERIFKFSQVLREKLPDASIHMFTNGTLLTTQKFLQLIGSLDELIIDNYHQQLKLIKPVQEIKEYCEKKPELVKKVTIVLRKPDEVLTSRGGDAPNRLNCESFPNVSCAFPFQQLIIRPTGKVSLCCNDALGRYTMGDLSKENLIDVWYGEPFKKIRGEIIRGRKNVEHCRYCDTFSLYL